VRSIAFHPSQAWTFRLQKYRRREKNKYPGISPLIGDYDDASRHANGLYSIEVISCRWHKKGRRPFPVEISLPV
jgi:hypothetical protein